MTLGMDDVSRIGKYIKPWIREQIEEIIPKETSSAKEERLLKRMVRVEVELKSRRELMDERFRSMDRRFENMISQINTRFSAAKRRSEAVDRRFDDIQENFKRTQWLIGLGFVLVTAVVTVFGFVAG